MVQSRRNIGGLLLDGNQDIASFVIEALLRVIITNLLDGVTDDLLEVDPGFGGDLAEHHDHARLGGGLAGDLGGWVLLEACIELRI